MNVNIALSTLNDFIFCPYSIYLHNVYMETDEDIFKTIVQLSGTNAHKATNSKKRQLEKLRHIVSTGM